MIKNIAILIYSLNSGGAQKQAFLLAKYLSKYYSIHLILYNGKNDEINNNINLQDLKNPPIKLFGNHIQKGITLYNFIKNSKIDLLFTYLLLANAVGGIIGNISGVKYVVGGIRSSQLKKRKLVIERILHNYINDFTIFNNYKGVELLSQKGFSKAKMKVIPNCFELKNRNESQKKGIVIRILSVGRFESYKDYFTALKAIKALREREIKFEYTIVGWGKMEKDIKDFIKKEELSDYVNVLVTPKNIGQLYLESDIFLLSSIFEGLPNVIMEAMSFSLPVVCTNVGDNNILIKENVNGYLCDPQDYEMISDRLYQLAQSQDLRNVLGLNGYNKLKDEYTPEIFTKRYLDFIATLKKD